MTRRCTFRASRLARFAARSCAWSERWFPDAFAFAILAVAVVPVAALGTTLNYHAPVMPN